MSLKCRDHNTVQMPWVKLCHFSSYGLAHICSHFCTALFVWLGSRKPVGLSHWTVTTKGLSGVGILSSPNPHSNIRVLVSLNENNWPYFLTRQTLWPFLAPTLTTAFDFSFSTLGVWQCSIRLNFVLASPSSPWL